MFYEKVYFPGEKEQASTIVKKKNSLIYLSDDPNNVMYANGDVKVILFK